MPWSFFVTYMWMNVPAESENKGWLWDLGNCSRRLRRDLTAHGSSLAAEIVIVTSWRNGSVLETGRTRSSQSPRIDTESQVKSQGVNFIVGKLAHPKAKLKAECKLAPSKFNVPRYQPTLASCLLPHNVDHHVMHNPTWCTPPQNHQLPTRNEYHSTSFTAINHIFFSWLITILAIITEIFRARYSICEAGNLCKSKISILPLFLYPPY